MTFLPSSFLLRLARRSGHGSWIFRVQVALSKVAKHSSLELDPPSRVVTKVDSQLLPNKENSFCIACKAVCLAVSRLYV